MATAESAGKTCVVCGKDVSGKPRVKDAAGHYLCAGECQQKAAAAAKARKETRPAPQQPGVISQAKAPLEPGGLLGQLIEDSPMLKAAKCESCGSAMPGGSVICTRCGFNTQTGKALKTAVIVEKETKEAKAKRIKDGNPYSSSTGPNGWVIFGVTAGVLSIIALTPLVSLEMTLPAGLIILLAWVIGSLMVAYEVYNDGSIPVVAVFIAMRLGLRFWHVIPPPLGLLVLASCELGMLAYVLFFVENRWARSLYIGSLVSVAVLIISIVISGSNELQKFINP